MILLVVFVLGAVLGSFLNVLIDRLSTDRPFVKGRSYCENCKKTLRTPDLIPILSFIILMGKCRFCRKKIPVRLFFVELLIGIVAVGFYLMALQHLFGLIPAISLFLVIYLFIGIFIADIIYGIIPDLMVVLSLLFSFIFLLFQGFSLTNHIISALACSGFFFALFAFTRGRGMGFGDVKLSFVLGFLLGFPLIVVSLYIAFLTGAAISIILVVCKKVRFFGGTIPFGPFLVASSIISLFYGQTIIHIFFANFL